MAARSLTLVLLIASMGLAGCLGVDIGQPCQAADVTVLTGPQQYGQIPMAPDQPLSILWWVENTGDEPRMAQVDHSHVGAAEQGYALMPLGDRASPATPGQTTMGLLNLTPDDDARSVDLYGALGPVGEACEEMPGPPSQTLGLGERVQAEQAEPGQGVRVYTAGFWTNGTLFYTNMPRVQFNESYPHPEAGEMGQPAGSEPLPVYVYDEDREERPDRYEQAGYFTTIQGFNEALKGMTNGTSRVTVIPPGQAYTQEGNEDHPLYGDTLVFYIQLVSIDEVDCQVPDPVCTVPSPTPPPPPMGAMLPPR